jgi:GxxExxY protein
MGIRRAGGLAEEEVTRIIIGVFFELFNKLGAGFLEGVYAAGMAKLLRARGLTVERETAVQVFLDGEPIALQRLDMLVNGRVVVEIKAGDRLAIASRHQLANYLRAARKEVGLLLHFGVRPTFLREYNKLDPE